MKVFEVGMDVTTMAFLRAGGFSVSSAEVETPDDLYDWLVDGGYDAAVIDLDETGWGQYGVRYLRSKNVLTAVVGLITADGEEPWCNVRATFLENGGDDLLQKPVNPRELAASLRAVTRRGKGFVLDVREIVRGDAIVRVNLSAQVVTVNGKLIHLTGKEMLILTLLASNGGRTQSKEQIMGNVYSSLEDEPEIKIIDVFVCKLRKKLAEGHPDAEGVIETVWGRGYKLIEEGAGKIAS